MTYHTAWLTQTDCALFQQFLDTTMQALRPDFDNEIPDGVGDTAGAGTVMNYALQRASHLAAFQWTERGDDACVRWEVFFAAPASGPARIGLRAVHDRLSPPDRPAWLARLLPEGSVVPPTQSLPGFLELVALLCSRGEIATSSAAATQALLDQQHELEYRRQLNDDLASELRQVNGKLRDVLAVRALTPQFEDTPSDIATAEAPRDLSELRGWALANESRIVILPRAFQGAKKSRYDTPETVYVALELLAGPYRDMRLGQMEHVQFQEALAASELQLEGSVAANVAGEQGDAYFVSWRGRRRFLELHLRKGGGRDERYCLRIYFFWDETSQKVVVGWLPSHLSNSLS